MLMTVELKAYAAESRVDRGILLALRLKCFFDRGATSSHVPYREFCHPLEVIAEDGCFRQILLRRFGQ
jgi:hypothetical protein